MLQSRLRELPREWATSLQRRQSSSMKASTAACTTLMSPFLRLAAGASLPARVMHPAVAERADCVVRGPAWLSDRPPRFRRRWIRPSVLRPYRAHAGAERSISAAVAERVPHDVLFPSSSTRPSARTPQFSSLTRPRPADQGVPLPDGAAALAVISCSSARPAGASSPSPHPRRP